MRRLKWEKKAHTLNVYKVEIHEIHNGFGISGIKAAVISCLLKI